MNEEYRTLSQLQADDEIIELTFDRICLEYTSRRVRVTNVDNSHNHIYYTTSDSIPDTNFIEDFIYNEDDTNYVTSYSETSETIIFSDIRAAVNYLNEQQKEFADHIREAIQNL